MEISELKQMRIDAMLTHSDIALFVFSDVNKASLIAELEEETRHINLYRRAKWFYICSRQALNLYLPPDTQETSILNRVLAFTKKHISTAAFFLLFVLSVVIGIY